MEDPRLEQVPKMSHQERGPRAPLKTQLVECPQMPPITATLLRLFEKEQVGVGSAGPEAYLVGGLR